jgi:hypothetical protein
MNVEQPLSALQSASLSLEAVRQQERISALDTLRRFALLGSLVMNISSFALHEGFDFHPTSQPKRGWDCNRRDRGCGLSDNVKRSIKRSTGQIYPANGYSA